MDLKSAYTQAQFDFDQTVFVKEPPRANGTFKHGNTIGILRKNLYGGKSGAFYFVRLLFAKMKEIGFSQSSFEPCLFFKSDALGTTLVSLSSDDIFTAATCTDAIDNFHAEISKYCVDPVRTR